jgi:hypothetical protein
MAGLIGITSEYRSSNLGAMPFSASLNLQRRQIGAMASDEIVHAAQIEFGFADCFYVFVVCEASISEDACGS